MNPLLKLNKTENNNSISPEETKALIEWLAMIFAYLWWAVIIVYYGLLDKNISAGYQLSSLPIVVISLALVQILKLSLKEDKKLLPILSIAGLFVSGLLA